MHNIEKILESNRMYTTNNPTTLSDKAYYYLLNAVAVTDETIEEYESENPYDTVCFDVGFDAIISYLEDLDESHTMTVNHPYSLISLYYSTSDNVYMLVFEN